MYYAKKILLMIFHVFILILRYQTPPKYRRKVKKEESGRAENNYLIFLGVAYKSTPTYLSDQIQSHDALLSFPNPTSLLGNYC